MSRVAALPSPWKVARRRIRELDPQPSLRTFLTDVAHILMECTQASGCGLAARAPGSAREIVQWVTGDRVVERVRYLDSVERGMGSRLPASGYIGPSLGHREIRQLSGDAPISRVVSSSVISRGRHVATVELVDPDPELTATPGHLIRVLEDVAVSFELALGSSLLRQERLESHLLREAGQELGRTLDLPSLLNTILDLLAQIVPYDAAVIYLLSDEGLNLVNHSLRGYPEDADAMVEVKLGQGIVGWVARTGRSEVVSDVTRDARYYQMRKETRSEMVASLKTGGRVIGVFNLESDRLDAYTTRDLELLEAFAGQAAAALERARLLREEADKRRLEQEVRIARRIQRSFLPRIPAAIRDRGLAARTLPSKEVSGDYYDVMERRDGSLAIAVADVSGKGIPAALIMSSLRAAFRLIAAEENSPAKLCAMMNEFLCGSLRETEFVTGLFGFLYPDGSFRFTNAGHNPPVLLRADGSQEWLETGGILLGAFPDARYASGETHLQFGDRLVLYTDGVTEAYHDERGEFGTEGMLEVIQGVRSTSPREICNALTRSVIRFVNGPLPDDLTIMVICRDATEE